ncbi:MAG: carboxyltransferase domain-containing protein [Arachnia sp.]
MRILPCGPHAVLLEFDSLDEVLAAHRRLRAAVESGGPWAAVTDLVPAARTLLVVTANPAALSAALVERLAEGPSSIEREDGDEVVVPTIYDGDDLAEVARLTGLTVDEVIAAHTGTLWRAAFGGFAPGFVYLVGGDPRLRVPRLSSPRTRVPAGAVALADEFSGVYPTASPGGWRLIGRTDAVLFDSVAASPSLIAPGDTVRFVSSSEEPRQSFPEEPRGTSGVRSFPEEPRGTSGVRSVPEEPRGTSGVSKGPIAGTGTGTAHEAQRLADSQCKRALVVERALLPVLVQDRGRPGLGAVGVSASGAADRAAYELGARLVGNERGEAALEITLGQAAFTARGALTVALTGAPCPAGVGGRAVSHAVVFAVGDGETLTLGAPSAGLRTYLSARGGIDAVEVLGSRARDTLGGLGPAPLKAGDEVSLGPTPPGWAPGVDVVPLPPVPDVATLRYLPGPRADWVEGLAASEWTVGDAVDRVGVRLTGRPLARRGGELPSEGVVRGAIQVPPSGEPVLFLADHPPTGGYPVVGVLTDASADAAAQLRPGDRVRLDPV